MTAIATARLSLLPPTVTDIKQQVAWLNDPEVVKYSEQRHKHHDFRTQCEYIGSFYPPNQLWSIVLDHRAIGTISAIVDKHNNVADLGILLGDRGCWGQGFGTETWAAVMQHLFNTGIRKIEAGCIDANIAMKMICLKTGMKHEGRRALHFQLNDHHYYDMTFYGKFNG